MGNEEWGMRNGRGVVKRGLKCLGCGYDEFYG